MPPKKQQQQNKAKKPEVDKTFGLKNKKGSKTQKMVQQIKTNESHAGKNKETLAKEKERAAQAKAKLEEEKRKAENAKLMSGTQLPQKVPFGVDPKSVVCQYFKAGFCEKGKKCKFSHDLDAGRKVEKKDIYTDARDQKDGEDTMDKWDQAKLADVVLSKHGNPKSTTDIVCKFFIQAIEDGKYGWFWQCPNEDAKTGKTCFYRHALPLGFVLKSQKKREAEEAKGKREITIEEFLETERHKLGSNLTPVTLESFAKWKRERLDKKQAEADASRKAKEQTASAGRTVGMSGRDLFTFNASWFEDEEADEDGDEWDLAVYRRQRMEEDEREEAERIAGFNRGFAENGAETGPSDAGADAVDGVVDGVGELALKDKPGA